MFTNNDKSMSLCIKLCLHVLRNEILKVSTCVNKQNITSKMPDVLVTFIKIVTDLRILC